MSILTADASSVADTGTDGAEETDPADRPAPAGAGHLARSDGAIDPARVRLFRGPRGVLRCTVEGEKSVLSAKVVRVFPLARDEPLGQRPGLEEQGGVPDRGRLRP